MKTRPDLRFRSSDCSQDTYRTQAAACRSAPPASAPLIGDQKEALTDQPPQGLDLVDRVRVDAVVLDVHLPTMMSGLVTL